MSDELAVGQRELSVDVTLESLSADEVNLIVGTAFSLLMDIVKASGVQTINAALGELSQNAAAGLAASAKPVVASSTGEEGAEKAAE